MKDKETSTNSESWINPETIKKVLNKTAPKWRKRYEWINSMRKK